MKDKLIKGAFWSFIDFAGGQVLSFLSFLVLARLLLPEDYGIVQWVMGILAIPGIIINEGFAEALIQREDLTDEHINAAFWANLALSVVFVLMAWASAGWLAQHWHEPLIAPVMEIFALSFISTSAASIASAIYRRRIQFATFALRTFVAVAVQAVVGVILALLGFGIWSLVISQAVNWIVGLAVMWRNLGWRPEFSFSWSAFRDLTHFTSRTMLANGLRFAVEKLDSVIVGAFLGSVVLGYYFLGMRLLMTINFVTLALVDTVMMPALSRMQDDRDKLTDSYVKMLWGAAVMWIPAVAGFGILAPRLVPLLFGAKWVPAIPVVMIVCVTAISTAIVRLTSQALKSVGKPMIYAWLNVVQFAIMLVSYFIGVHYGLAGAGWAYVATWCGIVPFNMIALHRVVHVPIGLMLDRYLAPLIASVIMVIAVEMIGEQMANALGDWVLLVQIPAGAVIYAVALFLLSPRALVKELTQAIGSALPARFNPAKVRGA